MKHYITILCLFFVVSLFGQDGKKTVLAHEVGINTNFVQNNLLGNPTSNNPYSISYKCISNNIGLRIGAGGTFSQEKIQEDGFADNQRKVDYSTDIRIGAEWRKSIADKWLVTAGLDMIGTQTVEKSIVDSGFDKVEDITQQLGIGCGPVFSLQFYINDHLSLATEGAAYFRGLKTTTARLFENFPEFDDQINSANSQDLIRQLPSSIYIVYRF
jgi:hypothetical protein